MGDVDGEPLADEPTLQGGREPGLVLHDEQSHARQLASSACARPADGSARVAGPAQGGHRASRPSSCGAHTPLGHLVVADRVARSRPPRRGWRGRARRGRACLSAGASDLPPPRTAAQLLADLRTGSHVAGYSGTVVQKSTLLPARRRVDGDGLSLARLMSGTNTIKVWYGGAGPAAHRRARRHRRERRLPRRRQIWQWDSNTRMATQSIAPAGATSGRRPAPGRTARPSPRTTWPGRRSARHRPGHPVQLATPDDRRGPQCLPAGPDAARDSGHPHRPGRALARRRDPDAAGRPGLRARRHSTSP